MSTQHRFYETPSSKGVPCTLVSVKNNKALIDMEGDKRTVWAKMVQPCKKLSITRHVPSNNRYTKKPAVRSRKPVQITGICFVPKQIITKDTGDFLTTIPHLEKKFDNWFKPLNSYLFLFNENTEDWVVSQFTLETAGRSGNAVIRKFQNTGAVRGIPTGPFPQLSTQYSLKLPEDTEIKTYTAFDIIHRAIITIVKLMYEHPEKLVIYFSTEHGSKILALSIFKNWVGYDVVLTISVQLAKIPMYVAEARANKGQFHLHLGTGMYDPVLQEILQIENNRHEILYQTPEYEYTSFVRNNPSRFQKEHTMQLVSLCDKTNAK